MMDPFAPCRGCKVPGYCALSKFELLIGLPCEFAGLDPLEERPK